jgi:transcriptional regulator with XRE-family HTH domain
MKTRPRLWAAIREKGLLQKEFARIVGDDPSVVSRIITGQWNPDEMRKVRYAKALGMKVEELFD